MCCLYGTEPFTSKQLLAIMKLVLTQNSSRRHLEFMSIIPTTISLEIIEIPVPEEDTTITSRTLKYQYGKAKVNGVGLFTQTILSRDTAERCPVTWMLLYMQSLGMIDSAINVWTGTEVINVDPNHFESPDTLLPKMKKALELLNQEQRRVLASDDETSNLGQFLDFFQREHDGKSVPFIPAMSTTHCLPMSVPIPGSEYNKLLGHLGTRYGYITGHDKFFGSTGARMSFVNDSNNAVTTDTTFDASRHLTIHADHSAQVARNTYISDNQYRSSIPANILQSEMNHTVAKHHLENAKKTPLCKEKGRFAEDWETLLEPLPPIEDILTKYASSPKKFGECACPVGGCPFIGRYQEDLNTHVKKVHPPKTAGKDLKAICPSCPNEYATSLENYVSNHLKRFCKKFNPQENPLIFDRVVNDDHYANPPPGVCPVRCRNKECTYWTTRSHASLLRKHPCKGVDGKKLADQKAKSQVEEPTSTSDPKDASNLDPESIAYDSYVPQKKKKGKKKKDPNKPKGVCSVYVLWASANRGRIKEELVKTYGTASHQDLADEVGRQWTQVPKSALKKYEELRELDKIRYHDEMAEYINKQVDELQNPKEQSTNHNQDHCQSDNQGRTSTSSASPSSSSSTRPPSGTKRKRSGNTKKGNTKKGRKSNYRKKDTTSKQTNASNDRMVTDPFDESNGNNSVESEKTTGMENTIGIENYNDKPSCIEEYVCHSGTKCALLGNFVHGAAIPFHRCEVAACKKLICGSLCSVYFNTDHPNKFRCWTCGLPESNSDEIAGDQGNSDEIAGEQTNNDEIAEDQGNSNDIAEDQISTSTNDVDGIASLINSKYGSIGGEVSL